MFKKIIAFLCALVMLPICFASCKKKPSETKEIVTSDLSNYTVVYGKNCDSSIVKKANVFAPISNACRPIASNPLELDKWQPILNILPSIAKAPLQI